MSEQLGITFQAVFVKAQSLVDGGWRISFDLAEYDGETCAKVASLRDQVLHVAVVGETRET